MNDSVATSRRSLSVVRHDGIMKSKGGFVDSLLMCHCFFFFVSLFFSLCRLSDRSTDPLDNRQQTTAI